jgi:hypothetical protein
LRPPLFDSFGKAFLPAVVAEVEVLESRELDGQLDRFEPNRDDIERPERLVLREPQCLPDFAVDHACSFQDRA